MPANVLRTLQSTVTMAVRGRKPGVRNGENSSNSKSCTFCEGTRKHFGVDCRACDATGEELVRKQMQKVYNAKNKLPLNYNLRPSEVE